MRRIAHKMIQEELHKEQHPQSTHTYRRITMSTIREDSSDVASSGGGPSRDVRSCCGKNGQRNGLDEVVGTASFGCSHVPAMHGVSRKQTDEATFHKPEAVKLPRAFQLRASTRASFPRGFKIRSRIRGAVGEKRWGRATLVTVGSQQRSEVATVDEETTALPLQTVNQNSSPLDTNGKRPSIGCESCFVALLGSAPLEDPPHANNTVASSNQHATGSTSGTRPDLHSASRHVSSASESLGSLGEDGSIHEAHEAHIVAASKPNSPIPCIAGNSSDGPLPAASDGTDPRPSCFLCMAASVHLQHAKHRSGPSVASHISTLNLPSPIVGLDSAIDGDIQAANNNNPSLTSSRNVLPLRNTGNDSKGRSQTVLGRRGSTGFPFQFRSLSSK